MNYKLLCIVLVSCSLAGCGAADPAPTKADHAEDAPADRVQLSAAQIAAAGISLETARGAVIRETIPVYGTIVPNAERVRDVAARFPGLVQSVAHQAGDAVRKGETLAIVESNESLQSYAVVAPLDGIVTVRSVNPGEQTGEKVLFTVADLSTVWADLALFPRDVASIAVGQTVRVASADRGLAGEGRIVYRALVGAGNQVLTARVLLANRDRAWAPGHYVSALVTVSESTVPLAVAASALQTLEDRSVVFVREADGFAARAVRTGRSSTDLVEIVSGLAVGETYAATNSFILKAELGKGSAGHAH